MPLPSIAPSDILLAYDGSLAGFYCCVFHSVYGRMLPLDIQAEGEAQATLLAPLWIDTEADKARRVREAIEKKISPRAMELTETVFLSCLAQRELLLLQFLLRAFQEGSGITEKYDDPLVSTLIKAEKHLSSEAHLLKGFVRFSDYDGKLVATISPKNFVLPHIAEHFADRYHHETFMIYDKTHGMALIHEGDSTQIVAMDSVFDFPVTEKEAYYRALWKQFYRTIGIAQRINPRCRMTHMPKRYWEHMLEVRDEL